jgi:hypothetical protein
LIRPFYANQADEIQVSSEPISILRSSRRMQMRTFISIFSPADEGQRCGSGACPTPLLPPAAPRPPSAGSIRNARNVMPAKQAGRGREEGNINRRKRCRSCPARTPSVHFQRRGAVALDSVPLLIGRFVMDDNRKGIKWAWPTHVPTSATWTWPIHFFHSNRPPRLNKV